MPPHSDFAAGHGCLAVIDAAEQQSGVDNRVNHPMIYVWGKLKSGVTVDQARTQMKGIAARLEKTYPETNRQSLRGRYAVT